MLHCNCNLHKDSILYHVAGNSFLGGGGGGKIFQDHKKLQIVLKNWWFMLEKEVIASRKWLIPSKLKP